MLRILVISIGGESKLVVLYYIVVLTCCHTGCENIFFLNGPGTSSDDDSF